MANAALKTTGTVYVILMSEGARLGYKGYAESIEYPHKTQFPPLAKSIPSFIEGGGILQVCKFCAEDRGLKEEDLIDKAKIIPGYEVVARIKDTDKQMVLL